jgi:hypothetical protein
MRGLVLVVVLVAGTVGCGPVAEDRSVVLTGDFDAIQVDLSNGDLVVEQVEGDEVLLDVDFGGVSRRGGIDRYVDDEGVLVLDYACGLCGGDLRVGVPAGLPVRAFVAHGDLELGGLSGPVSGEVRAGAITGNELACDAELFANAGAIDLVWSFRPVAVRAEAHVGAVAIELPAGGYALDTRSNLGVVRLTNVFDDPAADGAIQALAGAGEVAITGR